MFFSFSLFSSRSLLFRSKHSSFLSHHFFSPSFKTLLFLHQGLSSSQLLALRSSFKRFGLNFSFVPSRFWSSSFCNSSRLPFGSSFILFPESSSSSSSFFLSSLSLHLFNSSSSFSTSSFIQSSLFFPWDSASIPDDSLSSFFDLLNRHFLVYSGSFSLRSFSFDPSSRTPSFDFEPFSFFLPFLILF